MARKTKPSGYPANVDGRRHSLEKRTAYHRYRYAEGLTQKGAAAAADVSVSWAITEDRKVRTDPELNLAKNYTRPKTRLQVATSAEAMKVAQAALDIPPIPENELCDDALHQLEDFHYFCLVQFGVIATPWRRAAWHRIQKLWESPEKEYCIFNAPPGCGKSQLTSHDIPAYLTTIDRRIRGLIGSASERLATPYTRKLRTSFERHFPMVATDIDKKLGLAVDAKSTLITDFGRYRSDDNSDIWQSHQFQVELHGGYDSGAKEPTWQAYGRGAEVLGNRQGFIDWDDLVTKRSMRDTTTPDFIEWFEDEAETRLEPGGLFLMPGQRLGDDLYRNRLDAEILDLDDEGNEVVHKMYHHIKFPAHVNENCSGRHARGDPPAEFDLETSAPIEGSGCLIEPTRLSWRELGRIKTRNPRKYEVVYQQNDYAEGDKLVPHMWIYGGENHEGEIFPGCCDTERGRLQLPEVLDPRTVSVGSVDPSSAKFWSVQWWLNEPTFDIDHLIDLYKGGLTAGELLSYNPKEGSYYGMMHDWQLRSIEMGRPITAWVVETNAAQRYLLQHEFVHQWMGLFNVSIFSHKTSAYNKLDPDHGFWAMRNQYRWGKFRLPMMNSHNYASLELIEEAKRWDGERRGGRGGDDALMAQWIYRVNLPKIVQPVEEAPPTNRQNRAPSWMH